jgi:hypothetical protein
MRDTSFVVVPIPEHAFFKKAQFERLLCNHLLEILGLAAQFLDLITVCGPRGVTGQLFFPASMKSLDHL